MKKHLNNIIALNRSAIEKSQQAIQEAEAALSKLEADEPDTKLTLSLAREAQGDRLAEVRVEWDPELSELPGFRSEERRVGKEGRSGGGAEDCRGRRHRQGRGVTTH